MPMAYSRVMGSPSGPRAPGRAPGSQWASRVVRTPMTRPDTACPSSQPVAAPDVCDGEEEEGAGGEDEDEVEHGLLRTGGVVASSAPRHTSTPRPVGRGLP